MTGTSSGTYEGAAPAWEPVTRMARALTGVPGVRAVALGGSRARGTHRPDSDWDLGVYYRGALDLGRLAELAGAAQDSPVEVAGPGGWGPWVNGGAWLRVDGVPVDWVLRDLDRVEEVWRGCRAGRYEVGVQAGHPLGFWSPVYAGEVAYGRVLADPGGELAALRHQVCEDPGYPEPLRRALAQAAWEAEFSVAAAAKSAPAGDSLHVSLCLARAFGILTQSLHAHHRRWLLNEKGALAATAALPGTPERFAERVTACLTALDAEAVREAGALVREVRGVLDS